MTVLYEPSDQRCYIVVNRLSYRNNLSGKEERIVRRISVTYCKYHPGKRGL